LVLEEQKRAMKFAKETYVARQSLKTVRIRLPKADVIKRLKNIRV